MKVSALERSLATCCDGTRCDLCREVDASSKGAKRPAPISELAKFVATASTALYAAIKELDERLYTLVYDQIIRLIVAFLPEPRM